jgi:hypothetical protein
MRWPWNKREKAPEPVSDDVDEAVRARRHAEEALARDRERTGEIRAESNRSLHHARVNHFAQLISETFWGSR